MPLLFHHTACPSCGHRHNFCLSEGEFSPERKYTYLCPVSGNRATLQPLADGEATLYPTQGAVQLSPAEELERV